MTRYPISVSLLAALLLVVASPLYGQPTDTISFQGRLTTDDGTPVPDGTYEVTALLYTDPTGGSPRWSETHTAETTGGVFSLLLGQDEPLPADAFDAMPYLALVLNGEELQPRTPLSSVPYAMQARRLDDGALVAGTNVSIQRQEDGALRIASSGGSGGGLAEVRSDQTLSGDGTSGRPLGLADEAVTTGKLADEAVSTGKLDDEAVTTAKVDDEAITGEKLADDALVAGTNVTIQRQGDGSLEVAATGGGGLASVSSDATLAGDGTAGDPLQVAAPLVLTGSTSSGVVRGEHSDGTYGYLGGGHRGAWGENITNGTYGYLGGNAGAFGGNNNGNYGRLGTDTYGVYGKHDNANYGALGGGDLGALGGNLTNDTWGYLGGTYGAYGEDNNGNFGVLGAGSYAVYGKNAGNRGYLGGDDRGAYGENYAGNRGYLGGDRGAYGKNAPNGTWGYLGGTYGAYGKHDASGNYGRLGTDTYGVFGKGASGYAGYFAGDAHVTGTLSKGGGSFKIDHPLDPANKYLAHSFVESPDMMNVYNGNVTLDADGEATVTLPAYFEALNRDFRYQLTCVGGFAPVYVAEEITGNRFRIAGGVPGMKVSWQVTGIRQDAWANAHRIVVEEAKPAPERGYYLHPQLFGQPQERSVEWARDPEGLREVQAMPAQMEHERRQIEQEQRRLEQQHARMQRIHEQQ